MNRAEHLQWCKDRALEYLNNGLIADGMASFISDMAKHEGTNASLNNGLSTLIIVQAIMSNSQAECIRCVEGFN